MDKKKILTRELFYFLTVLIAVFFGLELIWPNIVLAYFNVNYLFIVWLISALVFLSVRQSGRTDF